MLFGKLFFLLTFSLASVAVVAQHAPQTVKIIGQMKNVMWKGELYGNIYLDTIADKNKLYGLGPVEYLTGEILILDGIAYKSTVLTDTTMMVETTYDIKASFFAYANIVQWKEETLPDSIKTIEELELYLDKKTVHSVRPYLYKLIGMVTSATIHVVNLPTDAVVTSPDEAHRGRRHYTLDNQPVEIVGFFSTEHKAVFTHHDTFLHMHLITAGKEKIGHLDEVEFKPGSMKLYLPQQ